MRFDDVCIFVKFREIGKKLSDLLKWSNFYKIGIYFKNVQIDASFSKVINKIIFNYVEFDLVFIISKVNLF